MALTTYQAVVDAHPGQTLFFDKASNTLITSTNPYLSHLFSHSGIPVAGAGAPGSGGAVCTNATLGALPLRNAGAGKSLYLAEFRAYSRAFTGSLMLYDRLVHASNFDSVSTTHTINTTALTRYTDGVDVECWLGWVNDPAALGTVTVSYTNQAGTAGRTGTFSAAGSGSDRPVMGPVRLDTGDYGVRSVQSVTIAGGSGINNDAGFVILLKRIALIGAPIWSVGMPGEGNRADLFALGMPKIENSACLALAGGTGSASDTPNYQGFVRLIEG